MNYKATIANLWKCGQTELLIKNLKLHKVVINTQNEVKLSQHRKAIKFRIAVQKQKLSN